MSTSPAYICLAVMSLFLIFYYPSETVALELQSTKYEPWNCCNNFTSGPTEPIEFSQSDPFTVAAEILLFVIAIRIIHLRWRYRRSNTRIFLCFVFIAAAYYLGFSSYLPDNGVDLTQQKFLAVFSLFLAIVPLFYKTRRKERIQFSSETKKDALEDQDYKCAICGRGLSRFNIDFDHKNGNRSDNRPSNCRALCTPCHRKRHAYGDD